MAADHFSSMLRTVWTFLTVNMHNEYPRQIRL